MRLIIWGLPDHSELDLRALRTVVPSLTWFGPSAYHNPKKPSRSVWSGHSELRFTPV